MTQKSGTYDTLGILKDAGLVAATAAATVGGSAAAAVLNLGAGRIDARVDIVTSAVEVGTGDEGYTIEVHGGSDASHTIDVVLAALPLGDSTKNFGSADSPAVGRYELPFTTEYNGVIYPYVKLVTRVVGTIATGINYTANLKRQVLA